MVTVTIGDAVFRTRYRAEAWIVLLSTREHFGAVTERTLLAYGVVDADDRTYLLHLERSWKR